jgi:arylsulfatase A-like enzyme
MNTEIKFLALLGCSALASTGFTQNNSYKKPNIIIINADDLGYGDVSCNGAKYVSTPNVDKVASQGLRFINFHATSATCTPSRFSLLTGQYAWRVPGTAIAPGDAAMIVTPEMKTLPDMLKKAGYVTGAVGKWHLGLGREKGKQNWNGEITPGLKDIGFDYSYIMAATGDRVPCVYIENGRVVNLDPNDPIEVSYSIPFAGEPTGQNNPELLRMKASHGHNQAIVNGIGRIGYMKGGRKALWVDETISTTITEKSVDFIHKNAQKPFFLYFATNDIHVPRVPNPQFVGLSGMGPRGDAILEFDWSVGEIIHALEADGVADNTILIITSDNGPVVDDGYQDQAVIKLGKHTPWGEFRGGKYSNYEAGTHVLGLIRWPNEISKGKISNAQISQVDLFASFAALTDTKLDRDEAPDSQNLINAILGKDQGGRKYIIEHAGSLTLIENDWKYILPNNEPAYDQNVNIELGNSTVPQLYQLSNDIGEKKNVAESYPDKVKELAAKLQAEISKTANKAN